MAIRRRVAALRPGRALRRAQVLLVAAARGYLDDRCPQLAASIAYYGLFAVFPLAILLVAGFALVVGEATARREVIDFALENLPLRRESGRRELLAVLRDVTASAGTFGAIGVAGLIFSASGLMGSLRHALSRVFDVAERRPPLRGKLLDILLVIGVGGVVAASLALTLLERLAVSIGGELEKLGPALAFVPQAILALGQLVPIVLTAAVFAFLYRFVPAREIRWRDCVPGAVTAAIAYEAVKTGFAFYLKNLASYGAVYGSIATVMALAFFVFLAANVFLAGAEMTAAWPRVSEAPLEDRPGPSLRRRLRRLVRAVTRS